jgi:hypothetical protein
VFDFHDEITYSAAELFAQMTAVCGAGSGPVLPAVRKIIGAARAVPPIGERPITLSIVTILTPLERCVVRFQRSLDVIALYLEDFPELAFEIVVCFGRVSESDPRFSALITVPPILRDTVRVISLPPGFGAEFHSPVFPEYVARNLGIRRARGKFVLPCCL